MADIRSIAEELVKMNVREVQEIASVMKDEYGIEPAAQVYRMKEQTRMAEDAKLFRDTSPKQYGISLLYRKRKKR
jgi:ribosomal protein L7/L12